MMKNAFYFVLKDLFILKIFKFLSGIFGHMRKWFNKKGKVNLKLMSSQTGEQMNTINIFPCLKT